MDDKIIITYHLYEMIWEYQCKDDDDFKRCVALDTDGSVKLLTVNGVKWELIKEAIGV